MVAASGYSGWTMAKRSYALLLNKASEAFRAAGIWILVLTAYATVFFGFLRAIGAETVTPGWAFAVSQILLFALACAATAVAWHRFILKGRRPTVFPSLTVRTLTYLICLVAFFVVVWLIPFVVTGVLMPASSFEALLTLVPTSIAFVLFAVSLRLALKLPAIAVDNRGMTLREAWRQSGPMWAGLVWGMIIVYMPAFILMQLLVSFSDEVLSDNVVASTLMAAVNNAVALAGMMLFATFLSLSYQFVVGDDEVAKVFA